jgi:hypothetical protein
VATARILRDVPIVVDLGEHGGGQVGACGDPVITP